jgi:hypothetical protein
LQRYPQLASNVDGSNSMSGHHAQSVRRMRNW